MTIIQTLQRLRQEDSHEFQASLDYIARTYPKKRRDIGRKEGNKRGRK